MRALSQVVVLAKHTSGKAEADLMPASEVKRRKLDVCLNLGEGKGEETEVENFHFGYFNNNFNLRINEISRGKIKFDKSREHPVVLILVLDGV